MREVLALGVALLAGCASPEAISPPPAVAAVAVRPLSWTGTARVYTADRVLALGVTTQVTPFRSARSGTWLLSEGAASTRSMIIEPHGGWLERAGKRKPMPAAMLRHERQQFAIYGLMQQAIAGRLRQAGGTSPEIPETEFTFDAGGRLVEARNRVDDPAGGAEKIKQVFHFSGELEDKGLRWPKRIDILHNGRPYFTLELESFSVGAP
jgi:hypothetical protein